MVDTAANDHGDRLLGVPETKPLASSDAKLIVNPSAKDKQLAEVDRTNQSSGSLAELTLQSRGLTREQIAAQIESQGDSVSIDYGNGYEASRKSGLTERDLASVGSKSFDADAVLVYDAQSSGRRIESDATVSKAPPVVQETPTDELDKRPIYDYGWGFKPDMPSMAETGVEYQAGHPAGYRKPEITEQGVIERVAALPLEQQAQVLHAGIKAYHQELNHQQFRIMVGEITGVGESVVGMSQGVDNLGKSICDVAQFSQDIAEKNPRADETAAHAGHSFGKLLVGGFRVISVADSYLGSLGAASYDGDHTKAFRDISALGQQMNERWQSMSPEEKSRLTTKLTLDNLGPIAAAGAGAKLAKSMDIAGALQDLGASASVFGSKEREKYKQVIAGMVDSLAPQPFAQTADGRIMPIPISRLKNDGNMLMSKSDDNLGANAKQPKELQSSKPEKPLEVTKEALDNPEGLAKLAKKFGITMPPKDTYVFVGEKDAVSAEAAVRRLGITKEQLKSLDEDALSAHNIERVPDYRDSFFNKHPGLIPVADRITVHHAIPKWVLKEHPGLFTAKEINDIESLRGIYKSVNDELHNDKMHNAWRYFALNNPNPTRQDVLQMVETLDVKYGRLFIPTEGI
ncbi:MAG: hypothetical protein C0464_01585 [Cyanobacteria bacterium DS2.008]|nr:hypothetical protein [Cyanobacteria bacterium DS2.008]